MIKECSNPTRCAEYNQDYNIRSHQEKTPEASKTYANCEGIDHVAYKKIYSIRVKKAQRTRQRITNKLILYKSLREKSSSAPLKRDNEFTLISSRKKRKIILKIIELRET